MKNITSITNWSLPVAIVALGLGGFAVWWAMSHSGEESGHTLKVVVVGHGTVSISPQKERYGETDLITLKATAADGFSFGYFEMPDGGQLTMEQVNFNIVADSVVTAYFV
jgi:hypothetical protein